MTRCATGARRTVRRLAVAFTVDRLGLAARVHPVPGPVRRPADLAGADPRWRELLFHDLLDAGYYVAPRGYLAADAWTSPTTTSGACSTRSSEFCRAPQGARLTPWRTTVELSADQARRMALAAQGFADRRPTGRVDRRHLRRVFDRIGVIQIDSVNVLVRSQELPLFARLGPHPRTLLADALDDGELFEYWAHVAAHRPDRAPPRCSAGGWRTSTTGSAVAAARRGDRPDFIERGPRARPRATARSSPPTSSERVGPKGPWWDWDDGKIALEYLFHHGRLAVRRRRNDFARLYDLPERVLPAAVLARADADRGRGPQGAARAGRPVARRGDARRPRRLPPPGQPGRAGRSSPSWSRRAGCCRPRSRAGSGRPTSIPRPRVPRAGRRPGAAQPVRLAGLEPRAHRAAVRLPLPHRDLHAAAEAGLRLLRAAVPARRPSSSAASTSRPTGPPACCACRAPTASPVSPSAEVAGELADELRSMAGWLGLDVVATTRSRRAGAGACAGPAWRPRAADPRRRASTLGPWPAGLGTLRHVAQATRRRGHGAGRPPAPAAGPSRRDRRRRTPPRARRADGSRAGSSRPSAVFWGGFLAALAVRFFWAQAQRPRSSCSPISVFLVARHRARRQPAGPAGLAAGHGDGADPVRRARRLPRVRRRHRHARRHADRRPARRTPRRTSPTPSTPSTTRSAPNLDAQEVIDDFNDPDGAGPGVHPRPAGQRGPACRSPRSAALLQLFSVLLFTFYLVADGPKMRRAICSRLTPARQERVLPTWELAGNKTGGYLYSRALLALLSAFFHWIVFQSRRHAGAGRAGAVGRHRQPVPARRRHLPRRRAAGAADVPRLAAQGGDRARSPSSCTSRSRTTCSRRASRPARWSCTRRWRSAPRSAGRPCSARSAPSSPCRRRRWPRRWSASGATATR